MTGMVVVVVAVVAEMVGVLSCDGRGRNCSVVAEMAGVLSCDGRGRSYSGCCG